MKLGLVIVSFAIALGLQSAAYADPASTDTKASSSTVDAKKAKSKECSDKADAKGLHGKARKKFRSECKDAK